MSRDIVIDRTVYVWKGGIQLGALWPMEDPTQGFCAEEFKHGCSWDFIDTEEDAIEVIREAWGFFDA